MRKKTLHLFFFILALGFYLSVVAICLNINSILRRFEEVTKTERYNLEVDGINKCMANQMAINPGFWDYLYQKTTPGRLDKFNKDSHLLEKFKCPNNGQYIIVNAVPRYYCQCSYHGCLFPPKEKLEIDCFPVDSLIGALNDWKLDPVFKFHGRQKAEELIRDGINLNEIEKRFLSTPLCYAMIFGFQDLANEILRKDKEFYYTQTGSLKTAIKFGYSDIADQLYKNYMGNEFNSLDTNELRDDTILQYAIHYNDQKIALDMISKSLEINQKGYKNDTPLMTAIEFKQTEIAELLIEKGVDVNAVNGNGMSALTLAVSHSMFKISQLLIEKGADVNLVHPMGYTILDFAPSNISKDLLELIRSKMSDKTSKKPKNTF
ncbi:MAG: ankyrin repeat domain-containing protein [Candidatus Wallbacteria bacterium]|nr:ankyrin repeat domain-containing protein [Candidatus Wallbacteria bacterium]